MEIIEMIVTLLVIISLIELIKNIKKQLPSPFKCWQLFNQYFRTAAFKAESSFFFYYIENYCICQVYTMELKTSYCKPTYYKSFYVDFNRNKWYNVSINRIIRLQVIALRYETLIIRTVKAVPYYINYITYLYFYTVHLLSKLVNGKS